MSRVSDRNKEYINRVLGAKFGMSKTHAINSTLYYNISCIYLSLFMRVYACAGYLGAKVPTFIPTSTPQHGSCSAVAARFGLRHIPVLGDVAARGHTRRVLQPRGRGGSRDVPGFKVLLVVVLNTIATGYVSPSKTNSTV